MLLVGLGNPGSKYTLTRHNVGFMVIDFLKEKLQAHKTSSPCNGELYKIQNHYLLKPYTFMNLSGESVIKVKNYFKIPLEEIVVIHDDLDLPFGAVRFKKGGGHGGHNGLKSCDLHLSKEYIRIRIGIGKPQHKSEVIHYVLENFTTKELDILQNQLIPHVSNAIIDLINGEALEKITSLYTIKKPKISS